MKTCIHWVEFMAVFTVGVVGLKTSGLGLFSSSMQSRMSEIYFHYFALLSYLTGIYDKSVHLSNCLDSGQILPNTTKVAYPSWSTPPMSNPNTRLEHLTVAQMQKNYTRSTSVSNAVEHKNNCLNPLIHYLRISCRTDCSLKP